MGKNQFVYKVVYFRFNGVNMATAGYALYFGLCILRVRR